MATAKASLAPEVFLTELRDISAQVESAQDVDRDRRTFSRTLSKMADRLDADDARKYLADVDVTPDVVEGISAAIRGWAATLNPIADQSWRREEVDAKLHILQEMGKLGLLSDEQVAEVAHYSTILTTKRSGGARERGTAPSIEGRAARVLTHYQGWQIGRGQRGDTATAPSNLRNQVVRHLESKGMTVSDADKKDLLAAAMTVCKRESATASALGVTFSVE